MAAANATKSYLAFQNNLKDLERLVKIRETLLGTDLAKFPLSVEDIGKQIMQRSDNICESAVAALEGMKLSKDMIMSNVERIADLSYHWVQGTQYLYEADLEGYNIRLLMGHASTASLLT